MQNVDDAHDSDLAPPSAIGGLHEPPVKITAPTSLIAMQNDGDGQATAKPLPPPTKGRCGALQEPALNVTHSPTSYPPP
jgi:hypothetical protein